MEGMNWALYQSVATHIESIDLGRYIKTDIIHKSCKFLQYWSLHGFDFIKALVVFF